MLGTLRFAQPTNADQLPDFGLPLNKAACGRAVLCEALCEVL
jgi:hypothetical protein